MFQYSTYSVGSFLPSSYDLSALALPKQVAMFGLRKSAFTVYLVYALIAVVSAVVEVAVEGHNAESPGPTAPSS